MKTARLALFVLFSLGWWSLGAFAMLVSSLGPCGMGPDAPCEVSAAWPIIAAAGTVIGYACLAFLFFRRWSR